MTSKLDICNLGLSHISMEPVDSLSPARTRAARVCAANISPVIRATLEAYNWAFARYQLSLALLPDTISGWDYVYMYPIDCLAPRELYRNKQLQTEPIPFESRLAPDKKSRCIVTNQINAELIYTLDVTDANLFSPSFVASAGLMMGSVLAMPLKKKQALGNQLLDRFNQSISLAKVQDANAEEPTKSEANPFVDARY